MQTLIVNDRPCPISKTTEYKLLFNTHDYLLSKQIFPILQNTYSGLVITGNAPTDEQLGAYYKSDKYISHTNSHKGIINRMYQFARRFTIPQKYNWVKAYLFNKRETPTLLDVGAGTGHFAAYVRNKHIKVVCIEQDADARNYMEQHFMLHCYPRIEEIQLNDNSVDVVTLWHVLEHINNPIDTLNKIGKLLKPTGKLVVAVPNCCSYDATYYKTYWAALDVPRHLWHFNTQTITQLAHKSGFKLVRKHRQLLDVFYISLLSEQNKGNNGVSAFIKAMLVGVKGVFKSLVNIEKTSSLVYIFEKKQR